MKLKLKDIKDIKELYNIIDDFKGAIYVVENKSKLDIKSMLCRVIIGSKIQNNDIENCYIECEYKKEQERLEELFNGKK